MIHFMALLWLGELQGEPRSQGPSEEASLELRTESHRVFLSLQG